VRRARADVDLHDRVPGANSSPKRIVNWLSDAPKTTATSASCTSRIAASCPNPPVTPRSKAASGKIPRPSASSP
jgi:hypothetical protein